MNTEVGDARIGQWYFHWDKGEMFQVTALDPESRTIEEMTTKDDWEAPLRPLPAAAEAWENTQDAEDDDPEGEGAPVEGLALDNPVAVALL